MTTHTIAWLEPAARAREFGIRLNCAHFQPSCVTVPPTSLDVRPATNCPAAPVTKKASVQFPQGQRGRRWVRSAAAERGGLQRAALDYPQPPAAGHWRASIRRKPAPYRRVNSPAYPAWRLPILLRSLPKRCLMSCSTVRHSSPRRPTLPTPRSFRSGMKRRPAW